MSGMHTKELSPSTVRKIEAAFGSNARTGRAVREGASAFEAEPGVSVPVPDGLKQLAQQYKLDMAALIAEGGVPALEAATRQAFHDANRAAMDWTNDYVRTHGTLSEQFGMI